MTLSQMLGRMRDLGRNPDLEVAHSEADAILIDALRHLAEVYTPKSVQADVDLLLLAYDRVDKWYA